VVEVATRLDAQLVQITFDLRAVLAGQIQELDGDAGILELLGASIQGNIASILHMLAHDVPAQRVEPPQAAVEYARRLAQRGVPLNALVRAYRVGHDRLLTWALDEVGRGQGDPDVVLLATRRLVADTFAYVDRISQQVAEVYEEERERWLANRSTVRAARLRELLAEPDRTGVEAVAVDVDAAEVTLGYALRRRHLGLVVWTAVRDDGLAVVERYVLALAERLAHRSRPLIHSFDGSTAWVWLPLGPDTSAVADTVRDVAANGHAVQVACGETASGVEGFRATHRQALQARAVALVAGPAAEDVTAFADVGAVALLCADLPAARIWVGDVLGPLAVDDEQHARLRETLRVFLAGGSSYTWAAEQLTLHKNSVRYRVARAEQVRGRPIRSDRFDVELALRACRWLGRGVLAPPG
jgi:DNA-binding PucR family transcriptional regulator